MGLRCAAVERERSCLDCGEQVPASEGFADWCECGWNLVPPAPVVAERGRFGAFVGGLARRSGELGHVPAARPLAYLVALLVLLIEVALVVGGVAAIVAEPLNPAAWLVGAIGLTLGWLMRPRIPRLPGGFVLDPALTPALHGLVEQVAAARRVPAPDGIVVTADWNAAWAVAGVRRRRWLVLGLPLLATLEPQQRVAVIAHELGHEDAGDLRHSLIVGTAVDALDALATALRPPEDPVVDHGPVEWVTRPLMWLAARPVEAALWLEARLLFRDLQRAEYVADARAAEVAGAAAVIALHERLLLHSTVELAVQHHALRGEGDAVLDGVHAALQAVPDRERERRRRVARLEQTRLTDTHPPLGKRIAVLEAEPSGARVTLDASSSSRIDEELAPLEATVSRELLDRYRGSLYSG